MRRLPVYFLLDTSGSMQCGVADTTAYDICISLGVYFSSLNEGAFQDHVIMFDQNALPRHSMGEDWGKNNYAKAYVAMKDFGMLPLDTSITNTENATNFNHYQTLNLILHYHPQEYP